MSHRLEAIREDEKARNEALKGQPAKKGLMEFARPEDSRVEVAFKAETVGLVTREQFVEKRNNIAKELHDEASLRHAALEDAELRAKLKEREKKRGPTALLSFAGDEEAEGEEAGVAADEEREQAWNKRLRFGAVGKNPAVDTSFLPDRDRDRAERLERERLVEEYTAEQAAMKAQPLAVTYSFFDGKGHRRSLVIKKGDTVAQFLAAAKAQLLPDFRQLRVVPVDGLLYVKEDLMLPHHYTFHELIVGRARGKSGPLFHFDVHDDVRLVADARVEKDESHAGKIVERSWYDKNRHIFPCSRWELFDPTKTFTSYSIHGDNVAAPK